MLRFERILDTAALEIAHYSSTVFSGALKANKKARADDWLGACLFFTRETTVDMPAIAGARRRAPPRTLCMRPTQLPFYRVGMQRLPEPYAPCSPYGLLVYDYVMSSQLPERKQPKLIVVVAFDRSTRRIPARRTATADCGAKRSRRFRKSSKRLTTP